MRKAYLFRLLLLTIGLLAAMTLTAYAAECTVCGGETGSDDYLCTQCLLKLLNEEAPESPVNITRVRKEVDGTVTVRWEDAENSAPYRVTYELMDGAPVPFGWTAAEGVSGTSCSLDRLVPGVNYIITVTDAKGNSAEYAYFAPVPEEDREIGAKIRYKTMLRRGGIRYNQKNGFSASEICEVNANEHGLYLRLSYSYLAYDREYAFQVSVTAPNGFADVVFSGHLALDRGRTFIPVWGFIPIDDYLDCLQRYYGGVPTGQYVVTMHFDGNNVYSVPFNMGE